MPDGEYHIDEKTFKSMGLDDQLWMLFTTFNLQRESCDKRFCKLERSKMFDKGIAAGSGFIGGLSAWIGKWLFLK